MTFLKYRVSLFPGFIRAGRHSSAFRETIPRPSKPTDRFASNTLDDWGFDRFLAVSIIRELQTSNSTHIGGSYQFSGGRR